MHLRLERVWRQSETSFLALLEEVKKGGKLSPQAIGMLQSRVQDNKSIQNPMNWTWLYPTRDEVWIKNSECLDKINGEKFVHKSIDTGKDRKGLEKS